MKKIFFLLLFVLCLILFIIFRYNNNKQAVPEKRPASDSYVFNYGNLLHASSEKRLNEYLGWFHKETGIEFLSIYETTIQKKDINQWTNEVFQNWKVGERTNGKRGLLFVLIEDIKQVRLEVGYDLEHIFTDAFVGYIENEQMKPFFENGRIKDGFEATLELIIDRALKALKKGQYSKEGQKQDLLKYYSGGAGAKKEINIGNAEKPIKEADSKDIIEYFKAQDTPEKTFALDLEHSRRRMKNYDLGIYNKETKEFFKNRVVTNAQLDAVRKFENVPFQLEINGKYAVIFYPDKDYTFSPFFLEKNDEGWQMDFVTMSKTIRMNFKNQWFFVSTSHPYMFAFKKYRIDENGFVHFNQESDSKKGYLNFIFTRKNGPVEVVSVIPGGSAARAGIKSGDIITHLNGKNVENMEWKNVRKEMKGAIGTKINMKIFRPGEKRNYSFILELESEI